ncbi:RNA-binding protein [Histomonas meleagridis]|uniref:RNA-binding protein n=1 Tax=Histomonas meleagridis TaxID=135588 RepID=UPI00355A2C24|nr:RNA-binding protein [Histomonas meleagridis]KAH0805238.1 RNA-binding protein [Histomonas meleagridis]
MSTQALEPKTIFVSNINYKTTAEGLSKFFSTYGKVKDSRILSEKFRGNIVSRGIGFVEFENVDGFNAAINANKDTLQLDGRNLHVQQARPPVQHKNDTIFIGGIPEGTTIDNLKEAFKAYKIVDAKIPFFNKGERFGFAFVKLSSKEERDKVVGEVTKITLNGAESNVRAARRDFDSPPRPRRFRRFRRARKTEAKQ